MLIVPQFKNKTLKAVANLDFKNEKVKPEFRLFS